MLSITDDLDDIYEEFLAMTSSSSSSVAFSPEGNSLLPAHPHPQASYNYNNNYIPPPTEYGIPEDMNHQQWRLPSQMGQYPNLGHPWLYRRDYFYNRMEAMMTSSPPQQPPPPPPPPDVKPPTALLDFPSGLEIVLKQVPTGCHALLFSSDIPDAAISRGYFTVAELLVLKRLLISRYTGQPVVPTHVDRRKVVCPRRGVKRAHEGEQAESGKVSVIRSTSSVGGVGGVMKEAMTIQEDQPQGSGGCQAAASAQ